jgi:cytochrome c553
MFRHDAVNRVFCCAALAGLLAVTGCDRPASTGVGRSGAEVFASCLLCHSTKEMQRGPILDGLPAWYVEPQLKKFADGVRGRNPENRSEALMGAGEAILHDAGERARVAEHIASLPARRHLLTVRGDKERGRELYAAVCAICHGPTAREGREDLRSPPLTPLEDWYQLDQLRKYQSGLRGTNTLDVEGQLMRAAVLTMSEQDFRDVTRYIAEELAATNAPAAKPN